MRDERSWCWRVIRFGVRPLYVCEHAGRLYFASEVKAIFAGDPTIPRAFDPTGLDQIFTFWTPVAAADGVRRASRIGARRTCASTPRRDVRTGPAGRRVSRSRDGDGFTGSLEDAVEAVRRRSSRRRRCGCSAPTFPSGAICRAGSTARSSRRSACGPREGSSAPSRCASRTPSTTRPVPAAMVERLGSEHHEVGRRARDIAAAFPDVVAHTERPILRTAPAPLFLLSKLVQDTGIKVVLTGEGADEMFAGYDLFREAKVRRFWARQPESTCGRACSSGSTRTWRGRPCRSGAMASSSSATISSGRRSQALATTSAGSRRRRCSGCSRPTCATAIGGHDVAPSSSPTCPPEFARWSPLAQDQYLEVRTLLSGYLLSSQGDRMLMAHSVEGRFPFLDRERGRRSPSRCRDAYKLQRPRREARAQARRRGSGAARDSRAGRSSPTGRRTRCRSPAPQEGGSTRCGSERAWPMPGSSIPAADALLEKCRSRGEAGQFSNADNMAVVGILSTQLVHHQLLRLSADLRGRVPLRTCVDNLSPSDASPASV